VGPAHEAAADDADVNVFGHDGTPVDGNDEGRKSSVEGMMKAKI
jgi:hypothetical protein